jgi:hypothetical protein
MAYDQIARGKQNNFFKRKITEINSKSAIYLYISQCCYSFLIVTEN